MLVKPAISRNTGAGGAGERLLGVGQAQALARASRGRFADDVVELAIAAKSQSVLIAGAGKLAGRGLAVAARQQTTGEGKRQVGVRVVDLGGAAELLDGGVMVTRALQGDAAFVRGFPLFELSVCQARPVKRRERSTVAKIDRDSAEDNTYSGIGRGVEDGVEVAVEMVVNSRHARVVAADLVVDEHQH